MAKTDRESSSFDIAKHADNMPAAIALDGDAGIEVPLLFAGPPGRPGLPVVEAIVDGKGPFRFGVETGAQFAGISPELADALALPSLPETIGLPRYRASTIAIGAATFADVPIMALRTAATDIDGILGFPFWRDLLVTIDYPAAHFRLERGTLPPPDGDDVLPIVPVCDGDFAGVALTIGDRTVTAVVDTRSGGAFGFTPVSAASVDFEGDLVPIGMARGAAIPETVVHGGRLAHDVLLGRHRIARPFVSVRPLPDGFPTEPTLGTVVLHHFCVTLDLAGGRIRFDRPSTSPIELPEPQRRPG